MHSDPSNGHRIKQIGFDFFYSSSNYIRLDKAKEINRTDKADRVDRTDKADKG